ncbi:UDP-galactose-4-epimerase [Legionella wadsworthii]|uniref:UDP-galactose-4-epimerase n=1 Tax=Legionella wadsworthii TaxID=28088 RepID=A0A378LT00_9GAMM|nr:SDR family NAD(P)-dependent oxidoreductase [Legionella wadsworthii]STY29837.1 UDP-galactose-4-epimerase [Legionella wadsworthii]
MKKVLITGGAGFIGSHLADELLSNGYEVRALDNLSEQVHGKNAHRPEYLNPNVELILGDIRDKHIVKKALHDIDAVFHFAAMVGVGQSMYQINDYMDVNNVGTTILLEALIESSAKKLIVASSMSVYGEGLCKSPTGILVEEVDRHVEDLKNQKWELFDSENNPLIPLPTPENKKTCLSSVYALSKYDQERLCLMIGKAYQISTTALRFFNVYGTRQALSNPYTGVLAIFASRILNGNAPLIFEDGMQKRDFVHVHDVARGCRLALESNHVDGEVVNIGSGNQYTIQEISEKLASVMNRDIRAELTGKYRVGDIRHCFADVTKARDLLGYESQVSLDEGLRELAAWLEGQIAVDHVGKANKELALRGLTV